MVTIKRVELGGINMESRFKHFTDYEVYMLSRQCVEASFEIVMMDNYSKKRTTDTH